MNTPKKLIIYNFEELFNILNEIKSEFNYEIEKLNNNNLENRVFELLLSRIKIPNVENQLVLNEIPLKITKLIEKINIEILKNNYSEKSKIKVGKYSLNLNSREIFLSKKVLKLTEQEIKMILYLAKSNKPVTISELQSQIWGYASTLETHTVETHIHRLRKKILDLFNDSNFILSTKTGYKIN